MNYWLSSIAQNKNLRGEDLRIIFFLLSTIEDGSPKAHISASQIAQALKIKRSNVYRSLSRLIKQQVISQIIFNQKIVGYTLLL